MNNSIYKKKIAFKQSLPQYKDGGKKFAAGLAGFATKIPMLGQIVDPMVSNTKLAKEFDTAFNAGQMAGGVANTVANAAVGNVAGAISSGADTVQEGLEMGSSIASDNNNQERAKRLTGASQGFGAVEGISGMFNTSQFGKGFNPMQMMGDANIPIMMKNGGKLNSIEEKEFQKWFGNYAKVTGMSPNANDPLHYYNYRQYWKETGGEPPYEGMHLPSKYKELGHPNLYPSEIGFKNSKFEEMKNGGMIKRADGSYSKRGLWDNIRANAGSGKKPTPEMLEQERKIKAKYEDGGYTYSTEGAKQGSNYDVVNPTNTSNFVEPKKKVLSETEKKLMQQQVVQKDGTVTDGLGNIIKRPEERATGRIEESVSPLDIVSFSKGAPDVIKGFLKYNKAMKPNYVQFSNRIFNLGPHPKTVNRAINQINKGARNIVLPEFFENGGLLQYNNGGPADLIKYNGATHDNSPIDGIPIAANGQQLNSGFSNNIPSNTKALVEDGEYYIKDKNYVITNNDKLKPTKDMSFLNPKKTFAENLTTIKNKYKGRENDPIVKTSYEREEIRLIEANEEMRLAKEAKNNPNPLMMAKNGGKLPKYFGGGTTNNLLPFTNPIQPSYATTNVFGSGVPKELNTSLNTNQNNIMGVQNPIAPNTGFNQRRAIDAGADFSRTEPFKYEPKSKEGNLFTQPGGIGAMANVPSTIYNIAQGLSPIKKTPAILTQRTAKQGPIKVDYNPLLMRGNVAKASIDQSSTSDAVRRANLQSLYRGLNTQLGELAQKEALTNVGIEQQNEARAMQENAADQRARQLAQQYNISAEQAKTLAMAEGMKGMGLIAENIADQQIGFSENEMKYQALQSMFANWKLANPGKTYADFLKSGQAGKITFNNLTA